MNTLRNRAKDHLPTVLLTLLGIVQALALELFWSHIKDASYLFELTWIAAISWTQLAANFLGIIMIWVVYANNTLRFRWVPKTSDSVYPFIIGLLEFILIKMLGPETLGAWFFGMAAIFGLVILVAHTTMKRARADHENEAFFRDFQPAVLRDFYPPIAIVGGLTAIGVYLAATADQGLPAMLALLATNVLLAWQLYLAARFWNSSMAQQERAE